jgi:NADH-quinone oxidoreductase subunit J
MLSIHSILFYLIAALIISATGMAITRRNLVHAVVYLVISFFGSAMLFYLFGAPLLAALEVIIYAGAIMVLFLFIIMTIKLDTHQEWLFPGRQLWPAVFMALAYLAALILIVVTDPIGPTPLRLAMASPTAFGKYLFTHHWLAIEMASLLLLIAAVGALILGKLPPQTPPTEEKEPS